MKLNVGCGRDIKEGWVNLDRDTGDVHADLNACGHTPLPFPDNNVDEFLLSHVLEHIPNSLNLMQELHRIAKHGALCTIRVPYGSSDDAWEDPTHVRAYFEGSFGYFSQPYYWKADYGYRGDWLTKKITLHTAYHPERAAPTWNIIKQQRNAVLEMVVELEAIKPVRQPLRHLQTQPEIVLL